MVTTTDSSSNRISPTSPGFSRDSNSPKFPRKNLPSPWAKVVRGGEPEPIPSIHQSPPSSSSSSSSLATSSPDQAHSSDCSPKAATSSLIVENSNASAVDCSDGNNGNAARPKKLAWNKPSNGVIEVGPVMGAVSWPALSESTKVSAKSSADSYSKTVSDGSLSNSQGPVTSHSPKKQGTSNAKPNSATNHTMPNRQRSTKRSDGSNIGATPAQSSFTHSPPPPPLPPFPVFPISPSTYGNMVPGVPDPPPREFPYRNNSWDTRPVGGFVSQPHTMNDHRSNSRRGNFGHHPRGDGSYHNNYGGRRDQDRGNYANTRDTHVQQSRASPRGSVRPPPPSSAGFVAPQPLGFFAGPMGFPEFYYYPTPPLESLRGMPFITHAPPAMFVPVAEPPLIPMLINQIEYYFSDANLIKDEFLRSNMDDQGWVPITLIASFPRVRSLTSNPQLILDSLRTSTVVEVQGEKMRRRNEWTKWLPSSGQLSTESGSVSTGGLSYDTLLANLQKVAVDEATTDTVKADPNSEASPGTCSTESSVQSQIPNGDTTKKTN